MCDRSEGQWSSELRVEGRDGGSEQELSTDKPKTEQVFHHYVLGNSGVETSVINVHGRLTVQLRTSEWREVLGTWSLNSPDPETGSFEYGDYTISVVVNPGDIPICCEESGSTSTMQCLRTCQPGCCFLNPKATPPVIPL